MFEKEKCYVHNVRLRYFTILCNANEYKMMGQGFGPGQLYNVNNEIKNFDTPWLGLLIHYNKHTSKIFWITKLHFFIFFFSCFSGC